MKAMLATQWGEPSEMQYADVPDPRPAAGEVLIETRAIGCNFPDILMVQGKYQVKPPQASIASTRWPSACSRSRTP